MNNKLAVQSPGAFHFSLGGHPVRVAVANPDGTPAWLVAADVAEALGVTQDGAQFTRSIPKGLLSKQTLSTDGGTQEVVCINLEGMMLACSRGRTPQAEVARQALVAGMVQAAQQVAAPAVTPELVGRLDRVLDILEPRAKSKVARVHAEAVRLGLLSADSLPPPEAPAQKADTEERRNRVLAGEIVAFLRTATKPFGSDTIATAIHRGKVNVRASIAVLELARVVERARSGRTTGYVLVRGGDA